MRYERYGGVESPRGGKGGGSPVRIHVHCGLQRLTSLDSHQNTKTPLEN